MDYKKLGVDHDTTELRKLILENPDLPIVVLSGCDANIGDGGWMYCESVRFETEEILDYEFYENNGLVFTDKEKLEDYIRDEFMALDLTNEEFEKEVRKTMKEFEPYWKKVIAIYADN